MPSRFSESSGTPPSWPSAKRRHASSSRRSRRSAVPICFAVVVDIRVSIPGRRSRGGRLLAWSQILSQDEQPVVGDQNEIVPAVAVDIAGGHVTRLGDVAGSAKNLPLKYAECRGVKQLLLAGEAGNLERLFRNVGEDHVGDTIGVQVGRGQI